MKRNPVEPPAKKATTRPLKKEGASVENEDRPLETINEDEHLSLPEVTGDIKERTEQPDDDAIIASFDIHQEAFLDRLMKRAGHAMGQEHLLALQKHQAELHDLQTVIRQMQNKQEQTPIKIPTTMETPRTPRLQDLEYQALQDTAKRIQEQQEQQGKREQQDQRDQRERQLASTHGHTYYGNAPFQNHPNDMSDTMQTFLSHMGSLLKNNNKSRDSITDLPKFQGLDTQWPKWYQLLRAYLQAKGWLTTFDHPIGPGTALAPTIGFDMDKNGEIYQKLHSKCWDGTAITYIRMAAEFDGHGAGKALKDRYNKRSPQQLESYKKLAKEHRHVSGTSMPAHIDQFETILSYMPECGYIPTAADRFEWFLPSVTEAIYASAKTHCLTEQINGTLEWGNMVHLFNHTCYQQYPHFLTADLQSKKLTQNTVKLAHGAKPCMIHPESNHTTEQCKKLRELKNPSTPNSFPKGRGKGKNGGKGKRSGQHTKGNKIEGNKKGKGYGSPKGKAKGERKPSGETCSHCHKEGHVARDCYTRKREMNQHTTHATHDEEIPIEFRNFVTFAKRPRDVHSSEYVSLDTNEDSDPSTPNSNVDEGENDDTSDNENEHNREITDEPDDEISISEETNESSSIKEPAPFLSYPLTRQQTLALQSPDDRGEPPKPRSWDHYQRPPPDDTDGWGETKMNYSPKRTPPYRSGLCQYCDERISTHTITGPLTCHSCRQSFKEHHDREIAHQTHLERERTRREDEGIYGINTPATVIESDPPSPSTISTMDTATPEEDDEDLPPTLWKQAYTRISYPPTDINTGTNLESWDAGKEGKVQESIKTGITHAINPFNLLDEIKDTQYTRQRINNSLTHLRLYPLLSLQSRWTSNLLAYQKSTLRKGYKQRQKRTFKIMRAIRHVRIQTRLHKKLHHPLSHPPAPMP